MAQKSENARLQIRSDQSVIAHLFSILEGDSRSEVRVQVLKLTCSIAEGHPAGVQLPPSPLKETAIATLLNIFTSSTNTEERSAAAGIIGRLPSDDTTINEMLCKSETLKAIHEVVCANDSRYQGMSRDRTHNLLVTCIATSSRSLVASHWATRAPPNHQVIDHRPDPSGMNHTPIC